MLTSVFERLRGQLFSRARNIVQNDDEARDILQDAFVKLWISKADIKQPGHAAGILNITVRNLSVDRYRAMADHPMTTLDNNTIRDNGENEPTEREHILKRVNEIISRHLSSRDREILVHRDRDGWEFDELADKYGLTAANVRMIVARARRTVREIYNNTETTY